MERDDDITLLLAKVHLIKERAKKENITITTQDAIELLKVVYLQWIDNNTLHIWENYYKVHKDEIDAYDFHHGGL